MFKFAPMNQQWEKRYEPVYEEKDKEYDFDSGITSVKEGAEPVAYTLTYHLPLVSSGSRGFSLELLVQATTGRINHHKGRYLWFKFDGSKGMLERSQDFVVRVSGSMEKCENVLDTDLDGAKKKAFELLLSTANELSTVSDFLFGMCMANTLHYKNV